MITISSFLPSRGIDRINAIISAIPSVVLHVVSTYKEDVTYVYKNMEKMINLKMSQASDDQKHMLYVKLLQARQMFHRQQFWNKTKGNNIIAISIAEGLYMWLLNKYPRI